MHISACDGHPCLEACCPMQPRRGCGLLGEGLLTGAACTVLQQAAAGVTPSLSLLLDPTSHPSVAALAALRF